MDNSALIAWAEKELHDPHTQEAIQKAVKWLSEKGFTWAEHEVEKILASLKKKD